MGALGTECAARASPRAFGHSKETGATLAALPDAMARSYATAIAALLLLACSQAGAIIVGRVYRPVVVTPFGMFASAVFRLPPPDARAARSRRARHRCLQLLNQWMHLVRGLQIFHHQMQKYRCKYQMQ